MSALVLFAALVPALVWTALAAWLGRVRPSAVVGLFCWGALVAAGAARAVSDLGVVTPVAGGPLVEEVLKALGLFAFARFGMDVRQGIASGAIVGIGFAMTENLGYLLLAAVQGGPAGLARGLYLRGLVGGWSHAIFTATTGAGVACARERPTWRGIVVGAALAAAVLQHVAWNTWAAVALTGVVCNPRVAGGPCQEAPSMLGLLLVAPAIAAVVLGPGVVVLFVLARRRAA